MIMIEKGRTKAVSKRPVRKCLLTLTDEYMLTGLWPDTEYELNITVVSQFGRAEEFSSRFTTGKLVFHLFKRF